MCWPPMPIRKIWQQAVGFFPAHIDQCSVAQFVAWYKDYYGSSRELTSEIRCCEVRGICPYP